MIDICMALDQSVSPAHWCADYSKYRGFLAGGSLPSMAVLVGRAT